MMRAPEFRELVMGRRSVRRFRAEAPTDAQISKLLEAAQWAPSASNKQPWRFVVVANAATIAAMAEAVRAAVQEIKAQLYEQSQDSFRAYGDYFTRFEAAPRVIVPIWRGGQLLSHLVHTDLAQGRRACLQATERDSSLLGCSLSIMNLLLMAHAEGLGASCMTGPLIAADTLAEILQVPHGWQIAALVPIGFADETPPTTSRKAPERVVRWLK